MRRGYLSQYFESVAAKRLSAVEADVLKSNQHEFNGVEGFKVVLGEPEGKTRYPARFLYLSDGEEGPLADDGFLTWYDARQKARLERGVMRWEYRLYFPTNIVSQAASAGDLLVIARLTEGSLLAIVAQGGSTAERQLEWLFGLGSDLGLGFEEAAQAPLWANNPAGVVVRTNFDGEQSRIGIAARTILEFIGVAVEESASSYLEDMLRRFGGRFPRTQEFSVYARQTLPDVDGRDDPDMALIAWMEREEILFRTLEKHLLTEQLRELLAAGVPDSESVIAIVQSALQRRKSRAGSALENHLEQIFQDQGVTYTRTAVTENNLRPDFIFPSVGHYKDPECPPSRLTMLAVKSTCKDRWRQILNEAARIPLKHLLTLEPSISTNQTREMEVERVQLVIPQSLHTTYTTAQQALLLDVADFCRLANSRQ